MTAPDRCITRRKSLAIREPSTDDPSNYNDYGLPTAKFSYVLEALAWSAVEIASVVVGIVIALEAFHWIKRGFAQKEDASQ